MDCVVGRLPEYGILFRIFIAHSCKYLRLPLLLLLLLLLLVVVVVVLVAATNN